CRQDSLLAGIVVPDHSVLTHRHTADRAAAAAQVLEHLAWREVHLLTQAQRDDGDIDEGEQIVGVRSEATAVERREHAHVTTQLRIMNRRIRLVAVDMQRTAVAEVERRKRVKVVVITASHDRPLSVLRHDERERGLPDLAMMESYSIFRGHIDEHASKIV